MKIQLKKKGPRNELLCVRDDGSVDVVSTNEGTALHDLAHYIVERELQLTKAFYGAINAGYSIAQLSTREVIMQLDAEAYIAEIVVRALQSLYAGACTEQQFGALVNAELETRSLQRALSDETVSRMYSNYVALVQQWQGLGDGDSLKLVF